MRTQTYTRMGCVPVTIFLQLAHLLNFQNGILKSKKYILSDFLSFSPSIPLRYSWYLQQSLALGSHRSVPNWLLNTHNHIQPPFPMSQDIQQFPIHIYMNPIGKIRQIQRHLWIDVFLLDLCPIDCSIRTYIFFFLIFPSLCLFVLNKNALGCEKISVQLIAPFPDQFHAEKATEVTQREIHRSVVLRNVCFLKEGLKKSTKLERESSANLLWAKINLYSDLCLLRSVCLKKIFGLWRRKRTEKEKRKIFGGEKHFVPWRRIMTEKEKEENIRGKIFFPRRRRRTGKENIWRRKMNGDANPPTNRLNIMNSPFSNARQ